MRLGAIDGSYALVTVRLSAMSSFAPCRAGLRRMRRRSVTVTEGVGLVRWCRGSDPSLDGGEVNSYKTLCANEPELAVLRASIRDFLRSDRDEFGWEPAVDSWLSRWDAEFSARLGDAGFLGLTTPVAYGGRGLGHLHRYVVSEELLAHGAPVAAHWMADRQVAPSILAHGSEEQRSSLLPRVASGRLFFAIGMSEYGAGSDLAASRTRAVRVEGGWLLNGSKVWTTGAHLAHQVVVLARTGGPEPHRRHEGFSQFLVGCRSEGLTIEPIGMMSGEHHFNEVVFDDVFVPDADVLGEIGDGWQQVTAELSLERSGPERILTSAPLIFAAISVLARARVDSDGRIVEEIGDLVARMVSLRQLSVSVARILASGDSAALTAALVKDLGTRFEQESVDLVARLVDHAPVNLQLRALLETAWLHRPLFTLRGGTNEVLRGIVARGLGLR